MEQPDLWSDVAAEDSPVPVEPDLRCSAVAWLPHQVLAAVGRGELYEVTRRLGDQEVLADIEGDGTVRDIVTSQQAAQLYQFEQNGLVRRREGATVRFQRSRRAAALFELTGAGRKVLGRWSHLVDPYKPFARHPRLRRPNPEAD